MSTWIDFKTLRKQLNFAEVLKHYGVEVKSNKGGQHHGFCPIPSHNGKRNSPSFSANLEKGIFNCFGCGAQGNVIDFAALMEGLSPKNGADVRKAALILQERFVGGNAPAKKQAKRHEASQREFEETGQGADQKKVVINAPLDFELKNLDPNHPYLDNRGFNKDSIAHFGLGFCGKGMLAGRIAIPIHNEQGILVGYAGRIVDDTKVDKDNPRYKFPPKREHKGVVYEFHKMNLVYNAHQIPKPVEQLAVVEGFPSVWWMMQMGFPNVVALMGWTCSEDQAHIISKLVLESGRIWLVSDGDEAGNRCGQSVFDQIGSQRFIRRLKLNDGKQPTDYPSVFFREKLRR